MVYSFELRWSTRFLEGVAARFSIVFISGLIGCGGPGDRPELGTVSGTVTDGGEPLPNAWIEFEPEKGRLSAGRTDEEGAYSLQYTYDTEGAVVGRHTVKIGTGGDQMESHSMAARNSTGRVRQQLYEATGIAVESGDNTLDFDISEGNEYKEAAPSRSHGRL